MEVAPWCEVKLMDLISGRGVLVIGIARQDNIMRHHFDDSFALESYRQSVLPMAMFKMFSMFIICFMPHISTTIALVVQEG